MNVVGKIFIFFILAATTAEPPNKSEIMDGGGEECDDPSIRIPRGGPIYMANIVNSSITSVPHFQHRLLYQVNNLQAELLQHSYDDDDDISYVYYGHSFSFH